MSADWQDYADGRILSGTQAFKLGFVDQLGNFDDAVERAKKLANINSADLMQYQQIFDFSNLFHLFGQSEAQKTTIKLDLGVDVPKIHAGYQYFLAPTYLQ